jgi:hypothetical protein
MSSGDEIMSTLSLGMRAVRMAVIMLLVGGRLPAAQDDPLQAAAKLTGLTAGMASACELQTTSVLHAFRDLMDRKEIQGSKRKQLVSMVEEAHARGVATQHKPGAMSCKDVQAQVKSTIHRLEHAK